MLVRFIILFCLGCRCVCTYVHLCPPVNYHFSDQKCMHACTVHSHKVTTFIDTVICVPPLLQWDSVNDSQMCVHAWLYVYFLNVQ